MFRDRLQRSFDLTQGQLDALEAHYQLLCRWNKVLNLTTVEDPDEAAERHYCESLFLGHHLPSGAWRIADIGSGPGFPGFPVAILRPECSVTLIESHQRKAVFLREASRDIPNIRVIAKRAEEVPEGFDWTVSRAVSYEDLSKTLPRLSAKALLLTGAAEPPESLGFDWKAPIPVPWGKQRYLRLGVSRGTQ